MHIGDKVYILPSYILNEMGLKNLAGFHGTITEIISHGKTISGCWVCLEQEFEGEYEWFIPYDSIGC